MFRSAVKRTKGGLLPRAEFDRLHRAHIASAWWKDFRRRLIEHHRGACSVCGYDYLKLGLTRWQLVADHKRYRMAGELIFRRETYDDVRCVCPDCNRKGVRSDDEIRMDRTTHWWMKTLWWSLRVPFWACRAIIRLLSRLSGSRVGTQSRD